MAGKLAAKRQGNKSDIIQLSAEESRNLMCAGFQKEEEHFFDKVIEGKVYTLYGEYLKPNNFRVDRMILTDRSPEKTTGIKSHVWSA